jgi:alkyl sulfatase BDS1-like metallo-beta-lactamase superfamily hydrolase
MGYQASQADLTLTINRADLDNTLTGRKSLEEQIKDGTARFEGDPGILKTLAGMLVDFTPDFEVFPGTSPTAVAAIKHDPFDSEQMKDVVPE